MNIVLIGPTHPFRGGIAHYTTLLARHLAERHRLCFLSFRKQYPKRLFPGRSDRDPSEQAVTGGAERMLAPLAPFTWWRAARRLAEARPELLIIQWWVPFWAPSLATLAFLARRWTDARIVFVCHNVLPHEGGRWWERFLIRLALARADAWILHSDRDEAALRALLPRTVAAREAEAPAGRAIHRALLPLHSISEPIDRAQARRRLNLPDAAPVALFFGFVRPYKGLVHLIEALPALRARLPELRLLVAGEFWEPAETYLARARALGQAEHIRIDDRYIPNEDVGAYFAAADVLVMPYVQATQSGVVTIAVEHGLPIVATRVGGLPEAVVDGRTGLIVPPADPAALAEAILAVLCDPELRQRLATGAAAARERFGWQPLVELLEAIGAGEMPKAEVPDLEAEYVLASDLEAESALDSDMSAPHGP